MQTFFLVAPLILLVCLANTSLSARDAFCIKSKTSQDANCSYVIGYNCKACHTLTWYIKNSAISQNLSNSVLYLLPGIHKLLDGILSISNVTNFTLKGSELSDHNKSQVNCTNQRGGILFSSSQNVSVSNVVMSHCGIDVKYSKNLSVHATLSFVFSSDVRVSGVLITNSRGLGLHVDNVNGYMIVIDSHFMNSTAGNSFRRQKYVSNARFYYSKDCGKSSTVLIENSSFMYGYSNRSNDIDKPDSSGLLILIDAPSIHVSINNITAAYNSADRGGNVGFVVTYFHENSSKISIRNSNISYGHAKRCGGGLLSYIKLNNKSDSCQQKNNLDRIVSISSVTFSKNNASNGGAVYIHLQQLGSIDCSLQQIVFTNCIFEYNEGRRGIAVEIIKFLVPDTLRHVAMQFEVVFNCCQFSNNKALKFSVPFKHSTFINSRQDRNVNSNSKASVMMVLQANSVNILSTNFTNNSATAISLVNSIIVFQGLILFKHNRAVHGGALNLCDSSFMYLKPYTFVRLVENKANISGGAIFAEQRRLDSDPPCFYQLLVDSSLTKSEIKNQVQLEYINNSAEIAGHAIYGGSVDECFQIQPFTLNISRTDLFKTVHDLAQQLGTSIVASDPSNVVLCNSTTGEMISDQSREFNVYSGEQFPLSLSAVGQRNGSVPAFIAIHSKSMPVATVQTQWLKKDLRHPCHTVILNVSSNTSTVVLEFSLKQISAASSSIVSYYNQNPPNVTIRIKQGCPWIFRRNVTGINNCVCAPIPIQCNITKQSFYRKKNMWVECHNNGNFTSNESSCDEILFTEKCPVEFCSNKTGWLSQNNASRQCQNNREGVLCGRCREGYSLTLGQPSCIHNYECPHWTVPVLLLAFAFAGILLVLFLAVFNFTVSQRTMYGLLFYANVVHANQKSLTNNCHQFVRIFISWINLDFGFEVCFYRGIDAYQKAWLEFVFIFYLLFLALLIVYLSHKFIFVTRLLGRNVVSVLSTVILLSFIKMARTAIKVLHYFDLKSYSFTKNPGIRVWYCNGNIGYLQGKHIPLALVSIAVVVVVSLYMLSLLFIQCLQRGSGWCVLRWVNKLRPFFDAYTGSCRDQYRFWPGFLLFSLLTIFLFQLDSGIDSKTQLYIALAFCVIIFVLACISPHGVYKKWPLNVLEFSFLLNLGILCSGGITFYKSERSIWISSVSIGIAAVTLVLIVSFHGYQRVSVTRKWQKFVALTRMRQRRSFSYLGARDSEVYSIVSYQNASEQAPLLSAPPVRQSVEFREPLLSEES